MADIKFSCPHCQQHIQAEDSYGGTQIACPSCNGGLIIPGAPAAPTRVSLRVSAETAPAQTQASVSAPTSDAAASVCPSCSAALPRGAILCINCGYNLKTGQRMVAGRPAAPGKPSSDQWETPWYKTAYPYVGLLVVALGLFYLLGRGNPAMMLAFVGTAVLYSLTIHIIVIVAAFRESAGTGFLTLCIPFYAIYFVFKVSDNDTLKILYGVAVLVELSLGLIDKTQ